MNIAASIQLATLSFKLIVFLQSKQDKGGDQS